MHKEWKTNEGLTVFLCGAGLSAQSGIPTFRGPQGYWTIGSKEYRPQELATFSAFQKMPEDIWAWYLYRIFEYRKKQPNEGHRLIVQMEEKLGDHFCLVTQNVDGLHKRAGQGPARLYEIHGNLEFARCSKECSDKRVPVPEKAVENYKSPALEDLACPKCGHWLRPHVLWFDECYNEKWYRYDSVHKQFKKMTRLVTIGTSGQTNLPTQIVSFAKANGIFHVDINPEETWISNQSDVHLQTTADKGLRTLLDLVT